MIDLKNAEVNRRIPKNRFSFDTSGVDTIYWKYKLSKDTTRLSDSDEYKELQVIKVIFKNGVKPKVFINIQKEIPYNILFMAEDSYYMVVDGNVLSTKQRIITDKKMDIDAISILSVVNNIVALMTNSTASDITTMTQNYVEKTKLQKQIEQLTKMMYSEVQPKRKFELHEEVLQLRKQLEELE